jgi:hypothetical protein
MYTEEFGQKDELTVLREGDSKPQYRDMKAVFLLFTHPSLVNRHVTFS